MAKHLKKFNEDHYLMPNITYQNAHYKKHTLTMKLPKIKD